MFRCQRKRNSESTFANLNKSLFFVRLSSRLLRDPTSPRPLSHFYHSGQSSETIIGLLLRDLISTPSHSRTSSLLSNLSKCSLFLYLNYLLTCTFFPYSHFSFCISVEGPKTKSVKVNGFIFWFLFFLQVPVTFQSMKTYSITLYRRPVVHLTRLSIYKYVCTCLHVQTIDPKSFLWTRPLSIDYTNYLYIISK